MVDRLCERYPEGTGLMAGAVLVVTSVALFAPTMHRLIDEINLDSLTEQ